MAELPPPPIFTLRAHKVGVTALAHIEPELLISGDETGHLILWDLLTFKRVTTYENVCDSKILSLKAIRLQLSSCDTDVLVVQSRNDGLYLISCDGNFRDTSGDNRLEPSRIVAQYPTYSSLFSRGDACSTADTNKAILAYPSSLESYLITVRFLGRDAETEISGSAARNDPDPKRRQSTVFDLRITEHQSKPGHYLLFAGYEDGSVVAFSFGRDTTETVPELNVTGLKIEVIKTFDLGLSDFVSALDLSASRFDHNCASLVCGTATKELRFIEFKGENLDPSVDVVKLSKPGTSVVSIRPDLKLVAAGGWDNTTRLFSLKSKRLLATLKNHTKQVSTILHIRKSSCPSVVQQAEQQSGDGPTPPQAPASKTLGQFLMYCASLDGTISVFDLY